MLPEGFKTIEEYNFPNIINVCVFKGSCTASCMHCPVGLTPILERKSKFGDKAMSLNVFKKIIDEISKFKHSTLRIHSVGEPLLWKNLEKALTYIKSKNIVSWIFTNAITTDKHLLDILIENCSIVEVSLNSFDKINYFLTKGIDAYELVKGNIEYMHKTIVEKNLKTRLIVSRVESENEIYDKKFVKYWKNSMLVADSFVRSYHDYSGILQNMKNKEIREIVPCHVHWARFNIDCDGKVVVCFNELFKGPFPDKTLVLGDVTKQSIQNIWHSKKLSLIRKVQLEGDYSIINFTKNLPCIKCRYCQPFSTQTQTSEHQIKKLGGKNGE